MRGGGTLQSAANSGQKESGPSLWLHGDVGTWGRASQTLFPAPCLSAIRRVLLPVSSQHPHPNGLSRQVPDIGGVTSIV